MKTSYPKSKISVLLLENIHPNAGKLFRKETYQVEVLEESLAEDDLAQKIKDVSILGIRSKTKLTKNVLENANRLLAVGAFCIGTNQIDLSDCLLKGAPVFNAPFSNTRSVVELTLGKIIMLMRKVFDKSIQLHNGKWAKTSKSSFEIRGKKLGIIGYGKIGSQLSVLAENLGMEVLYYDIEEKLALGNARKCESLSDLLKSADIISIHVDGRAENNNLIGEKEIEKMKDGVIILNASRGNVFDAEVLAKHISSGKVGGAGVDVFSSEPKSNDEPFLSPLQGMPNVILTPHIGGSTEEAQENIANYVPSRIIEYINTGNSMMSVNFPNLLLPELENAHRLIHIHKNVPCILAQINDILAKRKINIVGQYLKTNEHVGYVITDVNKEDGENVLKKLKAIPNTIKARILY